MDPIPLIGYVDRLSGRPGDTIEFKVSSYADVPFEARLVRVICADPNPAGPGLIEEEVDIEFGGTFPSRVQPFYPGSYASIVGGEMFRALSSFTIMATVWPITPEKGSQGIVSCWNPRNGNNLNLGLDSDGCAAVTFSTTDQNSTTLSTGRKLKTRSWYRIWAAYDADTRSLSIGQQALAHPFEKAYSAKILDKKIDLKGVDQLLISAINSEPIHSHFNGKIESPMIFNRPLSEEETVGLPMRMPDGLAAHWDFSQAMRSTRIEDIGPHHKHGVLVNMPTRAMTGSTWNGEEMCWRHAPEQYAAIHFHDDDRSPVP